MTSFLEQNRRALMNDSINLSSFFFFFFFFVNYCSSFLLHIEIARASRYRWKNKKTRSFPVTFRTFSERFFPDSDLASGDHFLVVIQRNDDQKKSLCGHCARLSLSSLGIPSWPLYANELRPEKVLELDSFFVFILLTEDPKKGRMFFPGVINGYIISIPVTTTQVLELFLVLFFLSASVYCIWESLIDNVSWITINRRQVRVGDADRRILF